MRKQIIAAALASTVLLSSAAWGRDGNWYVEADAGGVLVDDITRIAGPNNVGELDTKTGYDVGVILGHDTGALRFEAEASYRRANDKAYRLGAVTFDQSQVRGRAESLSFMGNALLDFGREDGPQFFAGGGAGYGRVKNILVVTGRNDNLVDHDWGFAWQGLAGMRFAVSPNVDVGLKYRFFNQSNNDVRNDLGQNTRTRFRSHSALLTLAYNFGASDQSPPPPPPPPPPEYVAPPPPPPPPPPVATCNKGPYIIFFDWDRSDITTEAAQILDSAVGAYANCTSVPVMLAGYADRSGSPQYNVGLSQRRNMTVRGYLNSHGIADSAISTQAYGEENPRVPTADGVRELQNRRVEISYGPGSGM